MSETRNNNGTESPGGVGSPGGLTREHLAQHCVESAQLGNNCGPRPPDPRPQGSHPGGSRKARPLLGLERPPLGDRVRVCRDAEDRIVEVRFEEPVERTCPDCGARMVKVFDDEGQPVDWDCLACDRDVPLVRGSQGRSPERTCRDGWLIGIVLLVLAALAVGVAVGRAL